MAKSRKVVAYTSVAAVISTPTAKSDVPIRSRVASTYAIIPAVGHTAGHTASTSVRVTVSSTRSTPAGNRMKIEDAVTGMNVPSATPASATSLTNAKLRAKLTKGASAREYA